MNEIIIVDLPKAHGNIQGCWSQGYPIHQGENENSLNYATVYANEHQIIPNQVELKRDFEAFKSLIQEAGFSLRVLPFPETLNQETQLNHDAVFLRDAGLMFQNFWIKANFSAKNRQIEAEVHAKTMRDTFNKDIIELPKKSQLEFGEVFLLYTEKGSYYFGGIARSNKIGHDFVRDIIKPDHYCLIQSEGYHLDTVFSPVIDRDNHLIACLVSNNMIHQNSLAALKQLDIELIFLDAIDSSGEGKNLGNYAVNTLIGPGVMLNGDKFLTEHVEEKLESFGIKRFVSPLTYFRYAGGSYHCLTNEVYQ
ncbi:MAG: hypothetical protein HOL27_03725 [Candidatus Marinimicrobia bacterium]|jgi:N-dimethylarginine dimethylaminohydrolase|nr:hypothetical protein [Candidatus Neomarinimicrobiota bacterium]MBT3692757.1 hypothetical protein [Candidatus Neomarinimicrobiota bacterium]MBT3731581.1 hypothetical protein [Candidatus Neomarinimicrobiota bacterium]MBT4145150.1 hypothetical protein [Candidatus Neomarinimicrobiota bacterium]MBT5356496.1 hypothetical protein [Candidatus Neomarinimicrobiota bacterium]